MRLSTSVEWSKIGYWYLGWRTGRDWVRSLNICGRQRRWILRRALELLLHKTREVKQLDTWEKVVSKLEYGEKATAIPVNSPTSSQTIEVGLEGHPAGLSSATVAFLTMLSKLKQYVCTSDGYCMRGMWRDTLVGIVGDQRATEYDGKTKDLFQWREKVSRNEVKRIASASLLLRKAGSRSLLLLHLTFHTFRESSKSLWSEAVSHPNESLAADIRDNPWTDEVRFPRFHVQTETIAKQIVGR